MLNSSWYWCWIFPSYKDMQVVFIISYFMKFALQLRWSNVNIGNERLSFSHFHLIIAWPHLIGFSFTTHWGRIVCSFYGKGNRSPEIWQTGEIWQHLSRSCKRTHAGSIMNVPLLKLRLFWELLKCAGKAIPPLWQRPSENLHLSRVKQYGGGGNSNVAETLSDVL